MPSPTSSSSVSAVSLSGNQNIDALLVDKRWASSTITYSFPGYGSSWSTNVTTGYAPSSGSGEPWSSSFSPLSSPGAGDDQTYFASALQKWANVAAINFVQVADTATNVGDIRAAYTAPTDHASTTVSWAYYPANAANAGDIWFSSHNVAATDPWIPGSYAFLAVMHELGHALGLKHPFDGSGAISVTLPVAYDSQMYTIMSYSAKPGDNTTSFSYSPTTPMVLDIGAMQYVYGANNSYHTADDTYAFNDASTYNETIWDAGGKDTISYSGAYKAIINLRPGAGSTIGNPVYVVSQNGQNLYAVSNVWIAYGVTIENASGGNGDDVMTGIDIAFYKDKRAGATLTKTTTGFTIKDSQGEGTDQLTNIERLQFSDKKLALDLQPSEHGGQALEFIGLMAPDLIKSPSVVGTILGLFDQGSSLHDVCQLAIDVGLVNAYAGSSSNSALAAMAYLNVVGTPASSASVDMLVGYMDGRYAHYSQADFMSVVAGLDLNQTHIKLVGLQQTGVEYA